MAGQTQCGGVWKASCGNCGCYGFASSAREHSVRRVTVREGQIWASTDRRDVEAGHNQRRKIVHVASGETDVWLTGATDNTTRVRTMNGSIPRHRLVRDTEPSESPAQGG